MKRSPPIKKTRQQYKEYWCSSRSDSLNRIFVFSRFENTHVGVERCTRNCNANIGFYAHRNRDMIMRRNYQLDLTTCGALTSA